MLGQATPQAVLTLTFVFFSSEDYSTKRSIITSGTLVASKNKHHHRTPKLAPIKGIEGTVGTVQGRIQNDNGNKNKNKNKNDNMRGSTRISKSIIFFALCQPVRHHAYIGLQNNGLRRILGEREHERDPHGQKRRLDQHRLAVNDMEDERTPMHFHRDVSLKVSTIASSTSGSSISNRVFDQEQVVLSPLEAWCLTHLDQWYQESQSIKCPFLRRRYGDVLDKAEAIMKNTVIRRECWPLMGPPQAWRPPGMNKKQQLIKHKYSSLESLKDHISYDWKPESGKGYYVTGKLTTACYRDDCLFLGPDPDMPIKGLRKYVGVAAHLFDVDASRTTLHSLEIVDDALEAKWELKGILRLPWHPSLPTLSGKTIYHVDAEGLIERHEEFWDISVAEAFCFTLFPKLARYIWKGTLTDSKGG